MFSQYIAEREAQMLKIEKELSAAKVVEVEMNALDVLLRRVMSVAAPEIVGAVREQIVQTCRELGIFPTQPSLISYQQSTEQRYKTHEPAWLTDAIAQNQPKAVVSQSSIEEDEFAAIVAQAQAEWDDVANFLGIQSQVYEKWTAGKGRTDEKHYAMVQKYRDAGFTGVPQIVSFAIAMQDYDEALNAAYYQPAHAPSVAAPAVIVEEKPKVQDLFDVALEEVKVEVAEVVAPVTPQAQTSAASFNPWDAPLVASVGKELDASGGEVSAEDETLHVTATTPVVTPPVVETAPVVVDTPKVSITEMPVAAEVKSSFNPWDAPLVPTAGKVLTTGASDEGGEESKVESTVIAVGANGEKRYQFACGAVVTTADKNILEVGSYIKHPSGTIGEVIDWDTYTGTEVSFKDGTFLVHMKAGRIEWDINFKPEQVSIIDTEKALGLLSGEVVEDIEILF